MLFNTYIVTISSCRSGISIQYIILYIIYIYYILYNMRCTYILEPPYNMFLKTIKYTYMYE